MENNKPILSYILQYLQKEETEQIIINDDSFVVELSQHNADGFWKRGARLVGIILTTIAALAFLIYSIVFYYQNVLFYRGELSINQFGAFTPGKSYSSEYAMYLFDTSEKWISSGIQVQDGDLLFISASGAFHSNYTELVAAAKNNTKADDVHYTVDSLTGDTTVRRLRWIFYPRVDDGNLSGGSTAEDEVNTPYKIIQEKEPARFGDVLFQVVPEHQISDINYEEPDRIYKVPYAKEPKPLLFHDICYRSSVRVHQDGVLAFMVNDTKPENNIGQILVVMEIFRRADGVGFSRATIKKSVYRWLDIPYYFYELIHHKGLPLCAILAYWFLAVLKMIIYCLIAYYLPILVYYLLYFVRHPRKEFHRLRDKTKHIKLFMKRTKSFALVLALSGLFAGTSHAQFRPEVEANIRLWEGCALVGSEYRDTLQAWRDRNDTAAINDAFGSIISFGTAGLRGPMGPGTNRINEFTVARATQGLANYLHKTVTDRTYTWLDFAVLIGYDSRHNSEKFASIAAQVLAANQIDVCLFDAMRPTPEISFAIRHLGCRAGINITASHNPKEDNGYKAYWCDGGQIVPPHDAAIMEEVAKISSMWDIHYECIDPMNEALKIPVGAAIDSLYASTALTALLDTAVAAKAKDLKIVYSPMHGAGCEIVPMCLRAMGINHISLVPQQLPDTGHFRSVQQNTSRQANPEDPDAMQLLVEQAIAEDADLAVATDPDADRFGFYCKDDQGQWQRVDGHQSTMLFTQYIIDTRRRLGSMPEKPFMGRTIVTSELVKRIADEAGITMYDEYTGFKWIAHRIETLSKSAPDYTFIGGGEESFCYLPYEKARDKDAPASICLLAEMTAEARERGSNLWNDLMAIYRHYGFQREYTIKKKLEEHGRSWAQMKDDVMNVFRAHLHAIEGEPCEAVDYKIESVAKAHHMFDTSDVLQYFTSGGIKVTIRPSGTEPTLKFYVEVPYADFHSAADYENAVNATNETQARIVGNLVKLLEDNGYAIVTNK